MKATAASAGSANRKAPGARAGSGTAAKAAAPAGATPTPVMARKPAAPPRSGARQAACAAADGLAVDKIVGDKVAGGPIAAAAAEPGAASKPATRSKSPADAKPAAKAKPPAEKPPAGRAAAAVASTETLAPADADSAPPAEASPPAAAAPAHPAAATPAPGAGHAPGQPGRMMQQPGRPMPAPRPLAKAENFAKGDHVVYPTHGVGKVERIAIEEIAGHKLELIHITFEENRMTLRVPVAKARTAGLRKLATRSLFDEALAVLRGKARIKRTMWSRRAQEYEAKINSGDPLAIAEVVRDLHRNAGQPDQSFSERQIYEAAMDRLAAELAALDQTDKPTAAVKLAEFLKTV